MEGFILIKMVALTRVIVLLAYSAIFAPVSLHAEAVRISYSAISWLMTPVWMAVDLGFFKKHNLDAQLIYIPSSATSVQALLGGSVDVITPGSSGVVIAAARGLPVVAVAASTRRAPFTLFTQIEITQPEELKGKVTGVTRFNSTTHMMTVLILRKLRLENFVSVRQMGDVPAMHNAFEQKLIAGMVSSYGPKARHRALTDAVALDIPYAGSMMTVTRSFLLERRDTLERVLRAYVEGLAAFLGQKERAKNVLAKYMRRNQPEFLDETFDTASNYLEPLPRVDPRIVPAILDFAGIKDVNPDEVAARVIDNSVLEKLQRENFFDNLFGKKR
jgi:ABC-type nitrate/sulfonate/bicarbonate transport system substrate-binding protein